MFVSNAELLSFADILSSVVVTMASFIEFIVHEKKIAKLTTSLRKPKTTTAYCIILGTRHCPKHCEEH